MAAKTFERTVVPANVSFEVELPVKHVDDTFVNFDFVLETWPFTPDERGVITMTTEIEDKDGVVRRSVTVCDGDLAPSRVDGRHHIHHGVHRSSLKQSRRVFMDVFAKKSIVLESGFSETGVSSLLSNKKK